VSYFGTIYKNNSIRKSVQDYAYCSEEQPLCRAPADRGFCPRV
jgi:hypothetical protein